MTPAAICVVVGVAAWPAPDNAPIGPADAVRAAAADLRRVAAADPARARETRYLTAAHVPLGERADLYAVVSYHVNGLSREATIVRPRRVNDWLWAVDLRDYGWKRERFGALVGERIALEPYYHAIEATTRAAVNAPWLTPAAADITYLNTATGSVVPIVRADWFLSRTFIQEGRGEFGYYDFLELRSRADAEKLAGLDRKKAEDLYREQAAVIQDSGVAVAGSRQLFRFSTIAGNWWETRDVLADKSLRDRRNPVRNLLGDYQHDAEEIVFTLPNRLPGFYLSDAAGKGVASAPPDIASDHRSASNDKRVHAGMSCVRCHTRGGLIPFDDLFRGRFDTTLRAADDKLERRLRSVYLGPIRRAFDRDADDYASAIADACGLTPAGLSAAVGRQWSRYADEPVTVERAAAETGFEPAEFLTRVRAFAARQRIADPVLLLFVGPDPRAMRREQFEELFPLLMSALETKP